jgi:hypothetical protein
MGKCDKCGQELGVDRTSQHFCTTLGQKSVDELEQEFQDNKHCLGD